MLISAIFWSILSLLLFPTLSMAQAGGEKWNDPHDYYLAVGNRHNNLLHNVEKYHLQQGIDKMNQSRYQYALADFDFILRYYPNHPQALLLISELSQRMKKQEVAVKYFDKALSLFPNYATTYDIYGIFLQKTGHIDKAVDQYNKALELEPDSSETHYNLGLAMFNKGDYKNALKHAERAYQLGYPLPGLRNKLVKAGIWKTTTSDTAKTDAQAEPSK